MSGAQPVTATGANNESNKDEQEEQRAQQARAEAIVAQVPNSPPMTNLPRRSNVSMANSPDEVAAHLIGVFEQHLKLQVANIEQMSDMWSRAWEQVRGTLELMENTAKIMQVVIGEASDTQMNLSDAVNRIGVVTTALAQTNLDMQALYQEQQANQ